MPDSDDRDVRPLDVEGDAESGTDVSDLDPHAEPDRPGDAGALPTPPDPTDPLKRDTSDDDEQSHPGMDPVTRPAPPE